jgi:hypothetical protein
MILKAGAYWQHFFWRKDYLLTLATLGNMTKNRNDPISGVAPPKLAKVTKTSRHVSLSLVLLH